MGTPSNQEEQAEATGRAERPRCTLYNTNSWPRTQTLKHGLTTTKMGNIMEKPLAQMAENQKKAMAANQEAMKKMQVETMAKTQAAMVRTQMGMAMARTR